MTDTEFRDVFWMRKRRERLGELYELCDNSSYNYSSYAESTEHTSFCYFHWICFSYIVHHKVHSQPRLSELTVGTCNDGKWLNILMTSFMVLNLWLEARRSAQICSIFSDIACFTKSHYTRYGRIKSNSQLQLTLYIRKCDSMSWWRHNTHRRGRRHNRHSQRRCALP